VLAWTKVDFDPTTAAALMKWQVAQAIAPAAA
jgi:hypothetical protein